MTLASCPRPDEWTQLVDGEATTNRSAALEQHARACQHCADALAHTRQLADDLAAPVPVHPDAVARVMEAIDTQDATPVAAGNRPRRTMFALAGAGVLAAALALFAVSRDSAQRDEFTARGGGGAHAMDKRVGVEMYASGTRLAPSATLHATAPLTAAVRNIETKRPVFMLLFAVDAKGESHWLFPAFTDPGSDPLSVRLEPNATETPLGESVVLDAPAPGPMTIITVLSHAALHVSAVEQTPANKRTPETFRARWPDARVRSLSVTVAP